MVICSFEFDGRDVWKAVEDGNTALGRSAMLRRSRSAFWSHKQVKVMARREACVDDRGSPWHPLALPDRHRIRGGYRLFPPHPLTRAPRARTHSRDCTSVASARKEHDAGCNRSMDPVWCVRADGGGCVPRRFSPPSIPYPTVTRSRAPPALAGHVFRSTHTDDGFCCSDPNECKV